MTARETLVLITSTEHQNDALLAGVLGSSIGFMTKTTDLL